MNKINTKSLLIVLVTFFASLMVNTASAEEHVWDVADNVYRYGNPNFGYFSLFVVTDGGVVVIESICMLH